jgi:hypothetical protein
MSGNILQQHKTFNESSIIEINLDKRYVEGPHPALKFLKNGLESKLHLRNEQPFNEYRWEKLGRCHRASSHQL